MDTNIFIHLDLAEDGALLGFSALKENLSILKAVLSNADTNTTTNKSNRFNVLSQPKGSIKKDSNIITVEGTPEVIIHYFKSFIKDDSNITLWFDDAGLTAGIFNYFLMEAGQNLYDIPSLENVLIMDLTTLFYAKGFSPDISRLHFSGFSSSIPEDSFDSVDSVKVFYACWTKLNNMQPITNIVKL